MCSTLPTIRRTPPRSALCWWGHRRCRAPGQAWCACETRSSVPTSFLVSKCGPRTEARTREWLVEAGFLDAIGMPAGHVWLCRQRPDKAGVCAELGVSHFVDDRLEVLSYMPAVAERYLFRPDRDEVAAFVAHLPAVHVVDGWPALCAGVINRHST